MQRRYPNARGSLCAQLGTSIVKRGASLQYLQSHNEKLARERTSNEIASGSFVEQKEAASLPPSLAPAFQKSVPSSYTIPTVMSHSAVRRFHQHTIRPTSSIRSTGTVIQDDREDEIRYPPLPKPEVGTTYSPCTICAAPLDLAGLTQEAWRYCREYQLQLHEPS